MKPFDRPIFIAGHPGGGTTMLDAFLRKCDDVWPRHMEHVPLQELLSKLTSTWTHREYAALVEQSKLWMAIPMDDTGGHAHEQHKKYACKVSFAGGEDALEDIRHFIESLVSDQGIVGKRYISKMPWNIFRFSLFHTLWPDAKMVAILRSGRQVIANRAFECGAPGVHRRLPGCCGMWLDVLRCAKVLEHTGVPVLYIKYSDFIADYKTHLSKILDFVELPWMDEFDNITLADRSQAWKQRIPKELHATVLDLERTGVDMFNELLSGRHA